MVRRVLITEGQYKGRLGTTEGGGPYYVIYFGDKIPNDPSLTGIQLHFTCVRYLTEHEYFKEKLRAS